jgi:hypothetical protein
MKTRCPDCDAKIGQAHIKGCDVERCTVCKGQHLSCSCKGHNRKKAVWDGDWPGVKECQERGWFCQDGFGPDSRWGSFCPCPADAPGAMEDLNRLAYFRSTGKDTLYDGCTRIPRKA